MFISKCFVSILLWYCQITSFLIADNMYISFWNNNNFFTIFISKYLLILLTIFFVNLFYKIFFWFVCSKILLFEWFCSVCILVVYLDLLTILSVLVSHQLFVRMQTFRAMCLFFTYCYYHLQSSDCAVFLTQWFWQICQHQRVCLAHHVHISQHLSYRTC